MPKTSTDHKFKRLNRSRTVMSRWVGSSELFWFWFFFPCISRLRNRSKVQYLNFAHSPTDSTHFLLLDFVEMPFAVFRDQFFKSVRHPVCPLFLPITHSVHWIGDSWITKDFFKSKKAIKYIFSDLHSISAWNLWKPHFHRWWWHWLFAETIISYQLERGQEVWSLFPTLASSASFLTLR